MGLSYKRPLHLSRLSAEWSMDRVVKVGASNVVKSALMDVQYIKIRDRHFA
jgi:hypothetical protein